MLILVRLFGLRSFKLPPFADEAQNQANEEEERRKQQQQKEEDDIALCTCLKLLRETSGRWHSKVALFRALNNRLRREEGCMTIGKPTFLKLLELMESKGLIQINSSRHWHAVELTDQGRVKAEGLDRSMWLRFGSRGRFFVLNERIEVYHRNGLPTMDFSSIPAERVTLSTKNVGVRVGFESKGTFIERWYAAGTPVVLKPE
jgi:hypothetical protein